MTTPTARRKTIHIHIGPHKTGSTAIQRVLRTQKDAVEAALGITPISGKCLRDLAKALTQEDEVLFATAMAETALLAADAPGDVLISREDFSGDLPGRTGKRRIYPRLWQNLNLLRKGFSGCDVKFYFFKRDPQKWLRSSYVQLLKHRAKFRSFDGYIGFLNDLDDLWDGVLDRSREKLGADLIEIDYEPGPGFSATHALFHAIAPDVDVRLPEGDPRPNTSPSQDAIKTLEAINSAGASKHAIQAAKQVVLSDGPDVPTRPSAGQDLPDWPPQMNKPDWLVEDLEPLWSRTGARTKEQVQPNLLPPLDCDLSEYRNRVVVADDAFPEGGRHHMENQIRILAYRFRDKPELCAVMALCISYLRRNTHHVAHAQQLFQRIWAEEHAILLGVLPTRWLISVFQTFMDHGANETQRQIGAAAFFLANTLKLYEAERALDGLPPDRPYPSEVPTTKSGFSGLDRFRVGGTDLMLNTNALLLELAARDDVAGRVAQEFLLRMMQSHTAFSRMDASRVAHKVDNPQFANCWSFYVPPKS